MSNTKRRANPLGLEKIGRDLKFWATAFMDLQGWGSRLRAFESFLFDDLSNAGPHLDEAMRALTQLWAIRGELTAARGRAKLLKKRMEDISAMKSKMSVERYIRDRVVVQAFTDSVFLSVSAPVRDMNERDVAVALLLDAVASRVIRCLASGAVVRVGVAAGVGIDYKNRRGEREILSSSLTAAHDEEQSADWFRVRLSTGIAETILRKVHAESTTRPELNAASEFVRRERDGSYSLNYLHPRFLTVFSEQFPGEIEKAHAFVRATSEIWDRADNPKLVGRYRMLARYWDTAIGAWTLSGGAGRAAPP